MNIPFLNIDWPSHCASSPDPPKDLVPVNPLHYEILSASINQVGVLPPLTKPRILYLSTLCTTNVYSHKIPFHSSSCSSSEFAPLKYGNIHPFFSLTVNWLR